jgi:hypothetical protein
MLGAAFIATQRGGEAFAQGTGSDRRVVFVNLINTNSTICAYRIWSDNSIDIRPIGIPQTGSFNCRDGNGGPLSGYRFTLQRFSDPQSAGGDCAGIESLPGWTTVDDGTTTFLRADLDGSRTVDAGDIGATLLDFGKETGDPPPPIDCTISAPR